MDKKQAEKLKAEKIKRRRRKNIRGYTMMALCALALIAAIVFGVKAAINAFGDNEVIENPIGNSEFVESTEGEENTTEENNGEENTETAEEGGSEENSEESGSEENTEENSVENSEEVSEENTETEPENSTVSTTPTEKPEQTWATMLVNQWSYMPEGYVPEVRAVNYEGVSPANNKFDVRAVEALEQMLADARSAGYNMYLVSAYRSHEYQINLFNRKVNEYKAAGYDDATAYSQASQWVAIPGTSEHCIGLAADIVSSTWYNYNSDLTHDFEDTEHFDWLYSHCAEYGFILRYPKGKESVTGITYEPWHYRYVGVDAAKYIMENNITLEEFWS